MLPSEDPIRGVDGLSSLWAETLGDKDVCVAILDGPVDRSHPCLSGADLTVVPASAPPPRVGSEAARHGTFVASLLFGRHDGPILGIAPRCRGLIVPIYPEREDGQVLPCSQSALAAAIVTAVEAGASLINISGGELILGRGVAGELADAIDLCVEQQVLVVAAAGNDGCEACLHVPAALPAVLAVGALDQNNRPLPDSNWGGVYRDQAVLAPGEHLVVAEPGGGLATARGTSFATPVVTGVAALFLSLLRKRGQPADPYAVRQAILTTAAGCRPEDPESDCRRLLAGRIDVVAATQFLFSSRGELMPRQTHNPPNPSQMPDPRRRRLTMPAGVQPSCDNMAPVEDEDSEIDLEAEGAADFEDEVDDALEQDLEEMLPSGRSASQQSRRRHRPRGRAAVSPIRKTARSAGVRASCGCGSRKGEYVYVIGTQLGYDFGTRVRQMSIQDNYFSGLLEPAHASVQNPDNFLRYLLGWAFPGEAGDREIGGNLYDLQSVHWVLYQEGCPVYAVRPQGTFAEAAYKELLHFYIDNHSINLRDFGVRYGCLEGYFDCHGGTSEPLLGMGQVPPKPEAGQGNSPETNEDARRSGDDGRGQMDPEEAVSLIFQETPNRAARIAIAGEITGEIQLSTGEVVEVINPSMRGTSTWNTARLVSLAQQVLNDEAAGLMVVAKLVSRLYDEARNDGKSPESRALNWAATTLLRSIRPLLGLPVPGTRTTPTSPRGQNVFDLFIGGLRDAAVEEISVKPSTCRQTGMEYDVEITLFNFENVQRGVMVLEQTVDVSDVVPVTMGMIRPYTRR